MSYYDPYDLVVGVVAAALEAACKTNVLTTDTSRVDLVETYDFSGDPTKSDATAIKIVVKPDEEIGENRGDSDVSYAIGASTRTRKYHVVVEVEAFTVKVTRDRAAVRDIVSKVIGRAKEALQVLGRTSNLGSTADGHWTIIMPATPFIQGGGSRVKDAGRTKSIKGTQRLVVGFVLQYTP